MDNLLSYFGLADVRINASDKDLPVLHNLNFPRKQPQNAVRSEHQHKSAVGQKKREKKETRVKRRGRKGQKKTLHESGDDGKKFRYSSSFVIKYIPRYVI